MTRKWTVLLLYPDYLADDFGQDTYLAHVEAESPREARKNAQKQAMYRQHPSLRKAAADFYCLAIFEGHLKDHA